MKVFLGTDTMHHCCVTGYFCQLKTERSGPKPLGAKPSILKKQRLCTVIDNPQRAQLPVLMRRDSYLLGRVYLFPFATPTTGKSAYL